MYADVIGSNGHHNLFQRSDKVPRILSVPPKFVRPCIPTTAKVIPLGDAWLHEPKLDGYRFQIVKDGRQVKLYSRSGYDWTRRLPALAETLRGGFPAILPSSTASCVCQARAAHLISGACRGR